MVASQRAEWDDTPPLRARVEDEIERLIALLDTLDGDENLEPSLGYNGQGATDDREGDPCDEGEPDDDGEPSMGWANPMGWRIGDPLPFDTDTSAEYHACGFGSDNED